MHLFGSSARAAAASEDQAKPLPAPRSHLRTATASREGGGSSGLRFVVLGSGSGGNSVLVKGPAGLLLIDAGFSCRNIEQRLKLVGVEPRSIRAILLTHEHGDHCRGVVRFVQRFKPKVFGTRRTFLGSAVRRVAYEEVTLDRPFQLMGLEIVAFPVPHDAQDPVGYVLEDPDGARLGLASDLGSRTVRAWRALANVDALIIESNHDPLLLERGPYPFALKRRVASRTGHLSNGDAAEGVRTLLGDRLRTVVPYHLSRTNNTPELAEAALLQMLSSEGVDGVVQVVLSNQLTPTEWLGVSPPVGEPAGL